MLDQAAIDRLRTAAEKANAVDLAVVTGDGTWGHYVQEAHPATILALLDRLAEAEKESYDRECSGCDLHAGINQAVSDALGQKLGETWHDLGEKVTALRERCEKLENTLPGPSDG